MQRTKIDRQINLMIWNARQQLIQLTAALLAEDATTAASACMVLRLHLAAVQSTLMLQAKARDSEPRRRLSSLVAEAKLLFLKSDVLLRRQTSKDISNKLSA